MTKTTIIYGFHAVESAILHNGLNIKLVWLEENRQDKRIQKLISLLEKNKIPHKTVSRDFLNKETHYEKHQGVVAQYENQEYDESYLENILKKENVFLLILDEIQDPHNLGACLRSANAVGVDAVIAPRNKAVGITSVVRKIASGAAEVTPFIQVTNLARTLKKIKKGNVWCFGLAEKADNSLYETDLRGSVAIIVGSEDKGLRRLTRENCDSLIKIPMAGTVGSLNVSVATGIALFETLRQRNVGN